MTAPAVPVRLLLVDDEELNRDMLSRRLARHAYEVVSVASGPEALAALDGEEFDLILLDVMMPDMSGLEVLRRLRLTYSAERLPVVMVTARAQSEDVVEALDLGANDYITKPVDMAVTLARIRTHVARRRAEQSLRESHERLTLAVEGANDGLWDWKPESGEVFYSLRWKRIMGYGDTCPSTLQAWFDRMHIDDQARVRLELEAHLQGSSAHFEIEHRVRQNAGHSRWVRARGRAIRDTSGRATRVAGSLTDVTEEKTADPLTGLQNRVLFADRLERLIDYGRRVPEFQFAVLYLDLDRFKNINDSLGYAAGDSLLVQMARRLERVLFQGATSGRGSTNPEAEQARLTGNALARLGGDEFAMVLSAIRHPSDATRLAERIVQACAEPFDVEGHTVFATVSIGVALSASGYRGAEDMLRDADIALYRAKAAGRACFEFFDIGMREQVRARLQLETDLRWALGRGELMLQYQPIISLAEKNVTSVEALVRWRHPQRGLLLPAEFLQVAEETALIVPIGYWVVREACRQLREWSVSQAPVQHLTMAVNLSHRHLYVPDLVERLLGIVREFEVEPSRIELEFPESSVMMHVDAAGATFEALKGAGFRLTIDDFGSGYSSLASLQRFRVDRLKIDRAFLSEMASPAESESIIRGIIDRVRHLDLEVVAEGIERSSQLAQLTAMHCGFGQGFLFSRPVAPGTVEQLL